MKYLTIILICFFTCCVNKKENTEIILPAEEENSIPLLTSPGKYVTPVIWQGKNVAFFQKNYLSMDEWNQYCLVVKESNKTTWYKLYPHSLEDNLTYIFFIETEKYCLYTPDNTEIMKVYDAY